MQFSNAFSYKNTASLKLAVCVLGWTHFASERFISLFAYVFMYSTLILRVSRDYPILHHTIFMRNEKRHFMFWITPNHKVPLLAGITVLQKCLSNLVGRNILQSL